MSAATTPASGVRHDRDRADSPGSPRGLVEGHGDLRLVTVARPGIVGRRHELAVIEAAWENLSSGCGTSVVITGPPGVGRSRLVAEFARRRDTAGDLVLRARCTPDPGAPDHWPWIQVLRQCGQTSPARPLVERLGRQATHLARVVPGLAPSLVAEGPSPPVDSREDPFPFYDATISLIRSVAEERPVAVVMDDAHWADEGSLRLLELLCRSNVDAAVLVVVTHRDLEASLNRTAAALLAGVARHGPRLPLAGLSEAGTAAVMASRTGSEPAASLVHEVHALTGGNPLFIAEAVRLLATDGSLSGLDKLPASLIGTAARVLDTLADDELAALEAAAVIGAEFRETVLDAVVSDHPANVHEVLAVPYERGIIEPVDAEGSWTFADPLVREAVLSRLDAGHAAHLHRRVGTALRGDAALRADRPAEIAAHFVAAARRSPPVGPAVELCRAAATRAANEFAHGEAVYWLEEAIDLAYRDTATTDSERLDLLLRLAGAQVRAGRVRSARDTFERARRLGDQRADVVAVARAVLGAVDALRRGPGWDAAIDDLGLLLERTVAELSPYASEHPVLLARLLSAQTVVDTLMFDPAAAQTRAAAARGLGTASDDIEVGHAGLVAARWAAMGPTPLSIKTELTDQLILHAAQTGDAEGEWLALRWRLYDGLEAGDPDLVDSTVARSIALAERLAQPDLLFHSCLHAATVALIEGRWDDVRRLHERGRQEASDEVQEEVILDQELYLSWQLGHVDLASVRMVMEVLPAPFRAAVGCWAGVAGDDVRAARSDVERFFDDVVLEQIPAGNLLPSILCMMAEAVARTGLVEHAETIRRRLLPLAERCVVDGIAPRAWFGSSHLYLGMLATVLDDHDGAERHLDAAQQIHRRMGARCHLVRGDIWRARLARRRGDQSTARSMLESALPNAELLGMTGAAAEARRDLDALRAPVRRPVHWELRRDGAAWRLDTGTASARLRHRKGLGYLHTLLSRTGHEVHVLELAGAGALPPCSGNGPVLDAEAKAAYGRRIEDLRDQVDEGERWGDPARVAVAQEELDAIARELASAMGLGGRDRPSDAGERARVSVRKAIRSAIDAVAEVAPEVAAHLDGTVRTGYYCSHVPDPDALVTWST